MRKAKNQADIIDNEPIALRIHVRRWPDMEKDAFPVLTSCESERGNRRVFCIQNSKTVGFAGTGC